MLLRIYNAVKAIYCTEAIFDFTILAYYILYNNQIPQYMEHALYG